MYEVSFHFLKISLTFFPLPFYNVFILDVKPLHSVDEASTENGNFIVNEFSKFKNSNFTPHDSKKIYFITRKSAIKFIVLFTLLQCRKDWGVVRGLGPQNRFLLERVKFICELSTYLFHPSSRWAQLMWNVRQNEKII